MTLTRPRLALVGVLGLIALSGCSGGGASDTAAPAAGAADSTALGSVSGPQDPRAAARFDAAPGKTADAATLVEQRAVIKNGDIVLRTADPQRARDRVDAVLTRLHGTIDDEQTVYDKSGQIQDSQLVLRVPVATFTTAMDDLESLGTVVHSSSSGKDVTTEVIDVQQRLRTLRISLHDLNSFQRQATNIDQLLRFESAITQRRGEYQSLKAQRNHLVSETSMSTISLDISVPPAHAIAGPIDHAGFLTGLRHGWSALTGTVVVALTAVGAVLPFAVVLAVLGLPLWWWGRRLWGTPPADPAPAEGPAVD
jgi:hypothetical protein